MSGLLVSGVFESALPAWLKPYAAACASFAADDGSRVFPSVASIARRVGRSERSTQRAMHELRARGILATKRGPGHHRATSYHFHVVALPHVGEPVQLPLFAQTFPQARSQKAGRPGDLHRRPQPWVTRAPL